uniref:Protein vip1 n=1 Tax=Anthurium amnicola TaxID=1678845 RepID=A0A1D1YUX8_9ARAE
MGTSDLTVKVLNISPKVTLQEICTFFSFCGTVDDIKLQRDGDGDGDQPYSAIVTFKQPYAFQTALLLDDALLVDRRVRVSPMENSTSVTGKSQGFGKMKKSQGGITPAPQQSVVQVVATKGQEVLTYARELDERYKVRKTGRELTKTAVSTAEQTASRMGTAIVHSSCFSKSALWMAGVLDRASKYAAELGNQKLRDDTNSRKTK